MSAGTETTEPWNGFFVSKLQPPQLPNGHVSRTELLQALGADASGLVSVTAPAGYGKTTLLAELADVEERPVGWVSLDAADNDPLTLLAGMATSFGRTQAFGTDFGESMAAPGGSALGRLGPRVANAVSAAEHPFVLVLDDIHEVSSLASRDVIDLVVDRVPAGSTVVVAGRTEPISLPRWRVSTDVVEIGLDDLAFDPDETARFMQAHGAEIEDDVARQLRERVEGWVAGLQLALVVGRRGSIGDFDGRDRAVADYLRSEVLDGLSPDDLRFLTRSAVMSEFDATSCNGVLGRDDSAAKLSELERANLFLVPLDRERARYRFHAAFRDLLLAELERSEGRVARDALHRRASEWYDAHGELEESVEHALLTDDPEWTVPLVSKVAQDLNARGRMATVVRWLDQIGDDAVAGHPPLAVVAGWMAAMSGDAPRAERWLHELASLSFDGVPTDGSTSFESGRAMFRAVSCADGPDQMLVDAELAMEIEPTWAPWRSTAELVCADALLLRGQSGDREAASTLLGDAITLATASEIADTVVSCSTIRALLAMDHNDWESARADVRVCHSLIAQAHMQDYSSSVMAYAAGARLAWHDGDRERASRLVAVAMRNRGIVTYAFPSFAVRLRLVLARVHLAMGEYVTARHLLREIDDVLRRRPGLGTLVEQTDDLRGLLLASASTTGASPLSPAELRVLPYLQTRLTFEEIGERLFLSRNTVGSHAKSIYRKLAVSSRGAAVQVATSMGLLGEIVIDLTP